MLLNLLVAASSLLNFEKLCDLRPCTSRMQEIHQSFLTADAPLSPALAPLFAHGDCYHLANYLDGEKKHYGAVVWHPTQAGVAVTGEFVFFYEENPYAPLTRAEAQAKFPVNPEQPHFVDFYSPVAQANMNPNSEGSKQFIYQYKMASASTMWVIAQWGVNHHIFCAMSTQD